MVRDMVRLAININCRSGSNLRMLRRSRSFPSSSNRRLFIQVLSDRDWIPGLAAEQRSFHFFGPRTAVHRAPGG